MGDAFNQLIKLEIMAFGGALYVMLKDEKSNV